MTAPIAEQTRCDDADEFSAFYSRWQPRLTSYVARRFGGRDVDEIVQETFVRALTHFHDLRRDEPWGWLSTVARNVGCDLRRMDPRHAPADPVTLETIVDSDRGPEESLLGDEMRRQIAAALGMLRPDDRQLLTMQAIDGLSVGEMAGVLDTTEGAVRARLFRARRRLSVWFEDLGGAAALAPLPLILGALRRLRRSIAPSATPALAAFSGLVAVTVVLGVTGAVPSFGTNATIATPMPAVRSASVVAQGDSVARASRVASAAATSKAPRAAVAAPHTGTAAPAVKLNVSKGLHRGSKTHDIEITVPTPVTTVTVTMSGGLDDDGNVGCPPLLVSC